jgi:hypothetical protein
LREPRRCRSSLRGRGLAARHSAVGVSS